MIVLDAVMLTLTMLNLLATVAIGANRSSE